MTTKKTSTKKLLAVIHITAHEIWGGNREPYKQILKSFYQVESSTELSYKQKLDLIDRLKAIRDGKKQPEQNRRKGPWASEAQVKRISLLTGLIGWMEANRLNGFIARQIGVKKSKWMVTGKEASKIIIGLQRILADGDPVIYDILNKASNTELGSPVVRNEINRQKN